MGAAQGITAGARFEAYWDKNSTSGKPLGALVVSQVSLSSATLVVPPSQLQFAIPPSAVAKLAEDVEAGQKDALRLFVFHDSSLLDLVEQSVPPPPGVVIVDDEIWAHLRFSKVDGMVKCQIAQAHYNFTHDWEDADADISTLDGMSAFLHCAAQFHRHLSLNQIDSNPEIRNIQVEIFQLKSNSYSRECRPIGNNLNTNNILDIVVGAETKRMYGIKITNKTDKNLYPDVFYFDNSDFSIRKLIFLLAYGIEQPNNFRMLL